MIIKRHQPVPPGFKAPILYDSKGDGSKKAKCQSWDPCDCWQSPDSSTKCSDQQSKELTETEAWALPFCAGRGLCDQTARPDKISLPGHATGFPYTPRLSKSIFWILDFGSLKLLIKFTLKEKIKLSHLWVCPPSTLLLQREFFSNF